MKTQRTETPPTHPDTDSANGRFPLTQPGQALESSRDSGFDLSAAVGENVDNSIEARATIVRIATKYSDDESRVEEIVFADNGSGIEPATVGRVLSLGFSTRYNSRSGLGRFGMGMKLAALSQARCIEIFTRQSRQKTVSHTILDLDAVSTGKQIDLGAHELAEFPEELKHLMSDGQGRPFESGTLVVWRRVDRLVTGGRYGTSVDERLQELLRFLARAYRKFIDKGLVIELDGKAVTLHDPLFLLDNPRVQKRFGDIRARTVDSKSILIDNHKVEVVVTLLPEQLRPKQGSGGRATKGSDDFKDLYIPDNESKVSILRQGREIFYELVPKLYPGGRDKIDRYIGVEVTFPAALDEYFQVRNVKRGAEPVSKLREELRTFLKNPIEAARREIRAYWKQVDVSNAAKSGDAHSAAHDIVDTVDQTSPSGQANANASASDVDEKLRELSEDMGLDPTNPEDQQRIAALRERFERLPVTLVDASWPGKEFIEIVHLAGKAIVRLNLRHPLLADVYVPAREAAKADPESLTNEELTSRLAQCSLGLELLFMAYAKAENMHKEPDEAYGELRSLWGNYASAYLRERERRA